MILPVCTKASKLDPYGAIGENARKQLAEIEE